LVANLQTPERIRSLQRKLYLKAKAEPAFLVRRHKVLSRSPRRFSYEAVFGELGVLELRQFRRDAPPCALR